MFTKTAVYTSINDNMTPKKQKSEKNVTLPTIRSSVFCWIIHCISTGSKNWGRGKNWVILEKGTKWDISLTYN